MKYTNVIRDYIKCSGETWCSFAKRSGVSRAALYKTLKGNQDTRIGNVEKLLSAAGYELTAVPSTPAAQPDPPGDEGGDDAA